jgi:hypothetical protein
VKHRITSLVFGASAGDGVAIGCQHATAGQGRSNVAAGTRGVSPDKATAGRRPEFTLPREHAKTGRGESSSGAESTALKPYGIRRFSPSRADAPGSAQTPAHACQTLLLQSVISARRARDEHGLIKLLELLFAS